MYTCPKGMGHPPDVQVQSGISDMRIFTASVLSASLALLLPLTAAGQAAVQRHVRAPARALPAAAPSALLGTYADSILPVWQTPDGRTLTVIAGGRISAGSVPASGMRLIDAKSKAATTGLQFNVSPNVYARAGIGQRNWSADNPACQPAQPGVRNAVCLDSPPLAAMQSGEVGAGYANEALKLDLSLGQARIDAETAGSALPRVLPSGAGAAAASPLWFPNSTTTSVNARGQLRVLPGTQLDLGASRGRVHFLPGAAAVSGNDLDQTTVSVGLEHGPLSGAIVGHVLEPALPGAVNPSQRWSGVDLGVSVRLPWQGELSFGAQNVWSSGKQPLINPQDLSPDQTRVPYVQYHQDL